MRLPLLPCLLVPLFAHAAVAAPAFELSSGPSTIYLEQVNDRQDLNFEIFIANTSDVPLEISAIQVSAYDAGGNLLQRRLIDGNGVRPSIQTVPERKVAAHGQLTVFNPFASFGKDLPLSRLEYQVTLASEDGKTAATRSLRVTPRAFKGKTALRLPLRGRVINYDGHDLQAHHRRFDYSFAPLAQMGFKSNFMRYSYDFVPVDANGETHRGDGSRNEDYAGFGSELLAAGDGVVAAVVNDRPDDRQFDQRQIADNPMVLFGNYLVIDHGNGEFSVYGHLKHGSVRVKPGQRLRQGEAVAQVGASGSAMFPHLHYELQDGRDTSAEGLPSYFSGTRLVLGERRLARELATVDTGEIVEAD